MPPSVITLTSKPRATVKLLVAVTNGFVYGISRTVVSMCSIFMGDVPLPNRVRTV